MAAATPKRRSWRSYSVYGLTLRSDVRFVTPLMPGEDTPDVTFTRTAERPPETRGASSRVLRHSAGRLPGGEPWVSLYRSDGFDRIHFAEVVDFYLFRERIVAHLLDPECEGVVETYLLGGVLAFWCERVGTPILHASAVVVGDRAVAFIAAPKGGKSSLAAALMERGHPLLSDDLLRIRGETDGYRAEPGFAQMRFWPHDAERLLGSHEGLRTSHPRTTKLRVPVGRDGFGTFRGRSARLGCLYFPRRLDASEREAAIELADLPSREAIPEILRGTFVPRWVEAAGYGADRLRRFADLATRVPLRTLRYPDGIEQLPAVRDAILADLEDLLPGSVR